MENGALNTKESIEFLEQFDWIHSFQVTNIFGGSLHNIPPEWLPFLIKLSTEELNNLPFLGEESVQKFPAWPQSLHNFLGLASRLSLERDQQTALKPTRVDAGMAKGMSPKKLHEVSYMASLVNEVCVSAQCDIIVDVGSGLGYLDHVLHQSYSYPVLGLETSDSHVTAAESRAARQGLQGGAIKSVKFELTNDAACFTRFESLLLNTASSLASESSVSKNDKQISGKPRVCLIGLHCCGDLSPTMMALFHQATAVRAICWVSCCYHKMRFTSDGVCPSFPLSSECSAQFCNQRRQNPTWLISPPTLRLGAQETRSRWRVQSEQEHAKHTRHVAYRGLLELADCGEAPVKRKLVRKCDFSSFQAFLDSYFQPSHFSDDDTARGKSDLNDLYTKHQGDFGLVEIITAFQVITQPVVESLVYQDRLLWLREQGYNNARIVPVFDQTLSPRNLATIAIK